MGVGRKGPKIFGKAALCPLGIRGGLPLKYACLPPHMLTWHFGRSNSNGRSMCMKIHRGKNGILMYHLSRSLQIVRNDMDRLTTYDFLLLIHSNYGPVSYQFQDKRWRFWSKSANFSHIHAMLRVPLEILQRWWGSKTRVTEASTRWS